MIVPISHDNPARFLMRCPGCVEPVTHFKIIGMTVHGARVQCAAGHRHVRTPMGDVLPDNPRLLKPVPSRRNARAI